MLCEQGSVFSTFIAPGWIKRTCGTNSQFFCSIIGAEKLNALPLLMSSSHTTASATPPSCTFTGYSSLVFPQLDISCVTGNTFGRTGFPLYRILPAIVPPSDTCVTL